MWGMTSRILLDVAKVAYGRDPEFPCESDVAFIEGEIWKLRQEGKMEELVRRKVTDHEVEAPVTSAASAAAASSSAASSGKL